MTATAAPPRPAPPPTAPRSQHLGRIAHAVALLALMVPRLHSGTVMWLDEAQSVSIARLPFPQLLAALRQDGSPPLYYVLLHVWTGVLGTGTDAARSLSTLCSLLALPLSYVVGRRLGGPRAGAASLLALAACPFAVRYATETRMYALLMLLVLVGILVTLRALERPTYGRVAAVALTSGLLTLTHYWCLFFLLVAEVLLLVGAARHAWRGAWARTAVALPLGGLIFVPWLPSFLFQVRHTGAPWAPPASLLDLGRTGLSWAGKGAFAWPLLLVLLGLLVLAAREPVGRALVLLAVGALVLGLVVSEVEGSAYGTRYSSAALVPVLLAAGLAAARLRRRARWLLGTVATVLSLAVLTSSSLLGIRSQAGQTAATLSTQVRPGDVVVFCPDQLGPAVDRLLPGGVDAVMYPTTASAAHVDWVDYASRNATASPSAFASRLVRRARGVVWLVRADGYLTFGDQCRDLDRRFDELLGGRTVEQQPDGLREGEWLVRYPAPGR